LRAPALAKNRGAALDCARQIRCGRLPKPCRFGRVAELTERRMLLGGQDETTFGCG